MRFAKVFLVTLVALTVVGASLASAQTPYIGVFFEVTPDFNGTVDHALPPGPFGAIDSIFFVAYNFNCTVTAIEFAVDYGPCLTHITDLDVPPQAAAGPGVTFGSTPSPGGISIAYSGGNPLFGVLPNLKDGFSNIHVATAIVQWVCTDCSGGQVGVTAKENTIFGDPTPIYLCHNQIGPRSALGLTALICRVVPVEETTWGKVKALYTR